MFDNDIINVISRYFHILAAIALLGGTIFMRFVLVPALDALDDEARQQSLSAARKKWAKIVMLAAAFLLISGLYNTAMISITYKLPAYYHMLLGMKILLALVVFFLSSALAGSSDMARKLQQKEKRWLHVNFVLAATVVLLASVMKIAPHDVKPEKDAAGTSQAAPLIPDAKG